MLFAEELEIPKLRKLVDEAKKKFPDNVIWGSERDEEYEYLKEVDAEIQGFEEYGYIGIYPEDAEIIDKAKKIIFHHFNCLDNNFVDSCKIITEELNKLSTHLNDCYSY